MSMAKLDYFVTSDVRSGLGPGLGPRFSSILIKVVKRGIA